MRNAEKEKNCESLQSSFFVVSTLRRNERRLTFGGAERKKRGNTKGDGQQQKKASCFVFKNRLNCFFDYLDIPRIGMAQSPSARAGLKNLGPEPCLPKNNVN